jgi:hypothetical protein
MVRARVYLPSSHHRALLREAKEAGVSMTEVVRRVAADHVEGRRGAASVSKEAVMRFVALGRSGSSDGSVRHDAVLDEAFRAEAVR